MAPWETRGTSAHEGGRYMHSKAKPAPPRVLQPTRSPVNPALVVLHGHQSCLLPQTSEGRSCAHPQRTGGHECTVDTPACQMGAPWGETHVASPGSTTLSPCPQNPGLGPCSPAA